MSGLSVPNLESGTGASGQIYAPIKKAIGSVPNTFAAITAHGPAAFKSVLAADAVLAAGNLTKRGQDFVKLVISVASGCEYCIAAHTHLGKLAGVKPEALKQAGEGQPSGRYQARHAGWLRPQARAVQRYRPRQVRDQGRRLQRRPAS